MPETPSMDDAFERLRRQNLPEASQNTRTSRTASNGAATGRWPLQRRRSCAGWRLSTSRSARSGRCSTSAAARNHEEIALAVTGSEKPAPRDVRQAPPRRREFWPVTIGLWEKPRDCLGFARGFCESAMRFWSEAKRKI